MTKRERSVESLNPSTWRSNAPRSTTAMVAILAGQLKAGGILFISGLLAQVLSAAVWSPFTRAHMIWMLGAALLCGLLLTPRARWPACILGALLGIMSISLFRVPISHVLPAISGVFVLVTITAWLLLRFRSTGAPLEDFSEVGRFVLLAGILLPSASGWWVVVISRASQLELDIGSWLNVTLAHSLGYILVVPAVVCTALAATQPSRQDRFSASNLLAAALLLGLLWLAWGMPWHSTIVDPLLILAPVPLLVWCAAVLGLAGASGMMLAVAFLCMWMSVRGNGPFVTASAGETILSVQIWTIGTAISLLYLSVMVEQRASSRLMLKRAYQQLSKVTARMLVVQEEERTHIARDLHDDISQSLAATSIQLSCVKRELTTSARVMITDVQDQLLKISNDIRNISHELHPSTLRFTGLASALEAFCEKHNTRSGSRLRCDVANPLPLTPQQKLAAFRIVQEAVHNIEKHAHATDAKIVMTVFKGEVLLTIEDDGVGYFPKITENSPPGLGIISMDERAIAMGGSFSIRPLRQGGTRVEVRFPISA